MPTILEMVVHTRLDCALGSAGLMRQTVRAATAYCSKRSAFGTVLSSAPVMAGVLADLSLESEAAVWMSMHTAAMFDHCARHPGDADAQAMRRLAVAVAKYYICKAAPGVVNEALESIGGNGYVEEWDFPRWFRQSPLNAVWEGSGNVIALDVLRTLRAEPRALTAFFAHTNASRGAHPALDAHMTATRDLMATLDPVASPGLARYAAEMLALELQGHALATAAAAGHDTVARTSAAVVLDAWATTRLRGGTSRTRLFGSLPPGALAPNTATMLVDRVLQPALAHLE